MPKYTKDKIEPLQKIFAIKCDEQLNILIGHMISYYQWNTYNDYSIIEFRDKFMKIANIESQKDENKCPLMQIVQELNIITSRRKPDERP